jgi:hypothetical protein
VSILQDKIDYAKLLVELFYCKQHNIPTSPFTLPKSKKAVASAAAEKAAEEKSAAE